MSTTYDGINVVAAVQAWWTAQPAMQALTSDGNLWHRTAPEDTALPYATVFLVSEPTEVWTTRYPFKRSTIQINLHADTDLAALTIALAVREALKGAPLAINVPYGVSQVCHCLPDGDGLDIGEELGPGGEDCWVAFETFDIPWTP